MIHPTPQPSGNAPSSHRRRRLARSVKPMVRGLLAIVFLALGLPSARAADRVSVQLDWVIRGSHALFFVAKARGYFAQNGIDVTEIRTGSGSVSALQLVADGRAEFGFADLPTLLVERSKGVPVLALAAVNQRSPLAMISLARSKPLSSVADLRGLTVGVDPAGSGDVFLKALLAANGLLPGDIRQRAVAAPYEADLMSGRVDVVPGYIDAEVPELEARAGGPGSLSILRGADHGWLVYGSGLFTSVTLAADRPDLVGRFTAAYARAFQDVVENPVEAVRMTVEANPSYQDKMDILQAQLQADIEQTFFSADTKANGIGHIDPGAWAAMVRTLRNFGALTSDKELQSAFDNRFIESARSLRR